MCVNDIPKVTVDTQITFQKNETLFHVQWKFHKEFVDSLTQYDLNENKIFDDDEKKLIEESLVSYSQQMHYLTNIEYKHQQKLTKTKYLKKLPIAHYELDINKEGMIFEYTFTLPFILENGYKLFIGFDDMGGNFDFTLTNITLHNYTNLYTLQKDFASATLFFSDPNSPTAQIIPSQEKAGLEPLEPLEPLEKTEETVQNMSFEETLGQKLENIKDELKILLTKIQKEENISDFLWLLLFSFLYGVLHAIGPGHGKSLVSSYFISHNKSYTKALSISTLIGIVHTFSAFILTLVVYYAVGFIFNSLLINVEQIATKVSALIIIMIALYLLFKKFRPQKPSLQLSSVTTNKPKTLHSLSPKVTTLHANHCGCNSCETKSTDLGVILAAGIVPCPGTVTIFLFTMSLGVYFIGFMSAIFMSLGMSFIIFLTSILSITLRKSSKNNTKLIRFFEFLSLFFILILGLFLLVM